ncbi:MAG: PIN domain-containing protein, partial [Terriglobia bacterium]
PPSTSAVPGRKNRAFPKISFSCTQRNTGYGICHSILQKSVEANSRYLALTDLIFSWLERPGSKAVTSTITMMELLVRPYRELDESRVDEFYGLLSTYPNLDWIVPDLEIADLAARIRVRHRLRFPDDVQAATAAHAKATGLITNDPVFERLEAFETLVLDQIL